MLDRRLFGPEVPRVAVVAGTDGDGLGAVHGRSAAHGQHDIDVLVLGQFRSLAHKPNLRIGAHPTQLDMRDTRRVE